VARPRFAGAVVGLIAVRTREIYLLMITLALAVGFSLFAQSNIDWFNGYEGIRNISGPTSSAIRSARISMSSTIRRCWSPRRSISWCSTW
jgi:ABC-type branched-subunit amino acid transport system permease subunit